MDSGCRNSQTQPAHSYNAAYVWVISSVGALGGLLFGYDWVVIGGAKPFYEKYFQLISESSIGWANSCALIGCLLGSVLSGSISDRFGRKKLLILSALLFVVSSLLTARAHTFSSFITWRIAGGLAIGIASNVSPTYIAEVSPAPWRGRLVTLNQLTIVVGILAAQIVNWLIADPVPKGATAELIRQSWNGQYGWRWMFTAVAVPSLIFFFAAMFIPESPRWLVKIGANQRARGTLARIGGEKYSDEAIAEIQGTLNAHGRSVAAWHELRTPYILKLLSIGVCLAVLQQWSGINIIFNYAEEIYRNAGYEVNSILFNIVAKAPSDTPRAKLRQMVSTLLSERFQLTLHHESRELRYLALVVDKGGLKMHETKVDEPAGREIVRPGHIVYEHVSGQTLAVLLTRFTEQAILDMTGLKAQYNVDLQWTPDSTNAKASVGPVDMTAAPSLFAAVREQLGLKLEARKGPLNVIVVDHAERIPIGN